MKGLFVGLFVIYLGVSFVGLNLNPLTWVFDARMSFIILSFVFILLRALKEEW